MQDPALEGLAIGLPYRRELIRTYGSKPVKPTPQADYIEKLKRHYGVSSDYALATQAQAQRLEAPAKKAAV